MYAHDGRLHFHRPFLDRLTNHKPDAPCALAAFLLLNVIDEMRHVDFDADAVNLRINAVFNPLSQAPSGDPQVFYLVRIAERLRQIANTRDVASITPDVIGYANWLTESSRYRDALSVLETGSNALDNKPSLEQANLQFRRGFALRQTGMFDAAVVAYHAAVDQATIVNDQELALLSQIGLAKTWRMMGLDTKGKTSLENVNRSATAAGLAFTSACARHDLANETNVSAFDAIRLTAEAFDLYTDPSSRQRCIADLGYMLVKFGYFDVAKRCLQLLTHKIGGTAFKASVLGTRLWVSAQTNDLQAFSRSEQESQAFEEQLAISTQSDISLRLAQGYLLLNNVDKARYFLVPALEKAFLLKGSPTFNEIRLTHEVLEGVRSPSCLIVDVDGGQRVNRLVASLDAKITQYNHKSDIRSSTLRDLKLMQSV